MYCSDETLSKALDSKSMQMEAPRSTSVRVTRLSLTSAEFIFSKDLTVIFLILFSLKTITTFLMGSN